MSTDNLQPTTTPSDDNQTASPFPPVATPAPSHAPVDPETLRLNSLAEEVPIDSILIGSRIRRDFSHVPSLAASIKEDGLIQPIVLDYNRRLIAGESRIRAFKLLGLTTIKAVYRGVLDEAQLVVLEASENNARQGLTWQERCLSVDKVHRLHVANGYSTGKLWGVRETGELLGQGKTKVGMCTFIAQELHANNTEVWGAPSMSEAFRIVAKQKEEAALKLIVAGSAPAKATGPTKDTPTGVMKAVPLSIPSIDFFSDAEVKEMFTPGVGAVSVTDEMPGAPAKPVTSSPVPSTIPLSSMLIKQDGYTGLHAMAALGPDAVDHIITDPPYGIDMDNLNQDQAANQDISDVEKEHDVVENLDLLDRFIVQSFTTIRDRGFLVMWCDPTHWMTLCNKCTAAGFRVQRWPLVWHKTSSCMNQSASTNFTKNVEFAVVARKGNATLISQQPSCVWTGGSDIETRLLGHPFAKPDGLWSWVYRAITQRGQEVLDPFVGVGSSFLPAVKAGLRPRGIECNDKHYGRLLVNVQTFYRTLDKNVQFT